MIKFRNSRLKVKEEILVIVSIIWFCTLLVHNFTDYNLNFIEENGVEYFDCRKLHGSYKIADRNSFLKSLDQKVSFIYDIEATRTFNKIHENITLRPLLNCFKQDDPYLIKNVKELLLSPRRKNPEPALINSKILTASHQELDIMEMVFKFMKGGFFIEAGAGNCLASVTETLQNKLNWTGLLVEAVPKFYRMCKERRESAWLINTCLSIEDKPNYINFNLRSAGAFKVFNRTDQVAEIMPGMSSGYHKDYDIKIQCLPVYSLLQALDNPTVNLFVLDIEGYELAVLRTIPWDKVDIQVFSIETDMAGRFQKDSSRQAIIELVTSHGYTRFDHRWDTNTLTGLNQNDLFVRNDIVEKFDVVQFKK